MSEKKKSQTKKKEVKAHLVKKKSTDEADIRGTVRKYISQQIQDPFIKDYRDTKDKDLAIQEPPFAAEKLIALPNINSILKQCVEAMVTNIVGNDWFFEYVGPDDARESKEAMSLLEAYEDLFNSPNTKATGSSFLEALCRDYITLGRGYFEVTRNKAGEIICLYHVQADTIRKTARDKDFTEVPKVVKRKGKTVPITLRERYRRYVMKVGTKKVYFKEFGDERDIDPVTGKEVTFESEDERLAFEKRATEIVEIAKYEPGNLYALPLWINQLPSILGLRLCEEVNLNFFQDNTIPAMIITVAGGGLTRTSLAKIQEMFEDLQGPGSMHKLLVLEAIGDENAAPVEGKINAPNVHFEKLQNERQNDAIFEKYHDNSRMSIQSGFRLPDIIFGRTKDYNRATAFASILMAESQVFIPNRKVIESVINTRILVDKDGIPNKFWRFKLKPTKLLSEEAIFDIVKTGSDSGALTPNNIIDIYNENFGLDLDRIDDFWGNAPANVVKDMFTKFLDDMANTKFKSSSFTEYLETVSNQQEPQ